MSSCLGDAGDVCTVAGPGFSYTVELDNSEDLDALYPALASRITALAAKASTLVIISDSNTSILFAPALVRALGTTTGSQRRVVEHVIPAGEDSKTREAKQACEDALLAQRCGRDTCIIALGGGVVGDFAGFVAATYMRCVPCIQVPTTLLAMVDSSIGSKTGVDTPAGKNLIGAFHHPLAVLISPLFLATLPARELSNGMAEVIKTGLIAHPALFSFCEASPALVLRTRNPAALGYILRESARVKTDVVSADPLERGVRSILNAGHTIGHAVEAQTQPNLLHGEAIAIGLVLELEAAADCGVLPPAAAAGLLDRARAVLRAYALPTELPAHLSPRALIAMMRVDKKNVAGGIRAALLSGLGAVARLHAATAVPEPLQPLTVYEPGTTLWRALTRPSTGVVPVSSPDDAALGSYTVEVGVDTLTRVLATSVYIDNATVPTADLPAFGPVSAPKPVSGSIHVPGSKSLSNRGLILAALSAGPVTLTGILHSDDTEVRLCSRLP
jgi:3-dehydroquinate synthase